MRSEGYKVRKILFQAKGYLHLFEDKKKYPMERETLMVEGKSGGKSLSVSLQFYIF